MALQRISKINLALKTEGLLTHRDDSFKTALSDGLKNNIISALGADTELAKVINALDIDVAAAKDQSLTQVIEGIKDKVEPQYLNVFGDYFSKQKPDEAAPKVSDVLGLGLQPTANPLLADTILKYNATKLSNVLQVSSLGVDDELPMLLSASNDQKSFLLKQWQVEKNWNDADVAKVENALGLMRVVGSQADMVTALWNEGIQKTADLATHNVASLKELIKKAKVGSAEATDNDDFARVVLLQAEQEHPSAFFMHRVAENPDWLGLEAADRPVVSSEFKSFYAQNKAFDLQTEPILSLETGLLNPKITGMATTPALIGELSAAQQALQISPDSDVAALLLAKKVNIHKATTATHKALMRDLDIDAATAVQIKQKAQYLHDATMNGYLAYRDIYSNPFLKNVLANLNPINESIAEGIGTNTNWEAAKQANGLRELDTIEDLFGSQNYCECDTCQSVLSPAAYFVDLMRFIESRVLESTTRTDVMTITETILSDTNPIHLKIRRPDLWTLKLTCENTNKRIPYIEIINEVLSTFVQQHLGNAKTIADRLVEEPPTLEFLLPYNQSLDELRTWLSFFKLQRLQVLEYLYPNPNAAEKLALAIERLHLSPELYSLIVDDALVAEINTDVLEFRRKSGLDDHETEQLVALKFWNNELRIEHVKDIGDIQKFSMVFKTTLPDWQPKIHRLIRLWKATGWSLVELDTIFQTFDITKDTLNEAAILKLADFKQLQTLLGFEVEVLVGILKGLQPIKSTTSKISWEQLLPRTWVADSAAKLDDLIANTEDEAVKILLDLQGIFGVAAADMLACLTLLKDKIGTSNPLEITFDIATLNTIFKYIQLYKWSKATSFEAFAQLLKVWGEDTTKHFDTAQDIRAFANYLPSFSLSSDDLLYLFGEELTTTEVIEEDKEALKSTEIREFVKQDSFKKPEQYALFFNKWLGIDQAVLGYFKNFIELTDTHLENLFDDLKQDNPTDATYIDLSNIKNLLERLVFLFDKYKIDIDTQKKIAQEAKDCNYLRIGFTTWKKQTWVKEIGYLGNWIAETRSLKNFDLFKILRSIEKEPALSASTQKAIAKWQKVALTQVESAVGQSNSISDLQALWGRFSWAKRLNINSELLDKLKVDVALNAQSEILQNAIRSKFDDNETWETAIQDYKNKLSSNLRDALCNFVIFNKDLRVINFGFKDRESLYQYFLLDVNMGDCFTLPRIVAATNSLQVYVHRCIMGLERSADEKTNVLLDIDEIQEWEWRKNYRVWEANRKIFLFPENYAEPEIRDNKSLEFKELEDELLQQKLNMEVVENAYKKYLEQIMTLAELRMAGAYFDKAYNRIYLFGKTNKQPVEFYYRYLEFLESGGVIWSNWEKMNISIPAEDISAIRHNGKLHIFWTTYQRKDISNVKSGNAEVAFHTYDVFVNYSYLKVDKKWSAPQRVEMGYRTNSPFDPFLRIARYNENVIGSNTPNPSLKPEAEPFRENVLKEFEQTVYRKPYPVWAYDQNFLNLNYIWTDKKDALTPQYKYSRAMIDAFKVQVKLVFKYDFFGMKLDHEMNFEFSFNRFDEQIHVAPNNNQTQGPANINIATREYKMSAGGEELRLQLSFSQDSQGIYHYSFRTTNAGSNKRFFFKENNKELKSGDVDIHHQIDYVPVSKIEYNTETVDMSRQKRVPKSFNFRAMSPDLSATQPNRGSVRRFGFTLGEIMTMYTSASNIGVIDAGISIVRGNSLASEYNTYYDNFNNFFVTDGTSQFADGYNDYKIQQRDMVAVLTTPTNADPNKGHKLNPEQIQMLWDKISVGIDSLLDTQTSQRHVVEQMDYSQSFGNYFYELFFHIPMRIADHLNAAGKYREANHWYSYIYNPTAIKDKFEQLAFPHDVNWRFAAFRNVGIQKLRDIYKNQNAIEMYRRNPGNPHAIARLRIGAYQKNVVMKYLDNLMDWADNLFQQYTPESTSEARHLYSVVKTILGNKPQQTGKCNEQKELTYSQIGRTASNEFIYNLFAPQQAVVEEKQQLNAPAKIANDVSMPMIASLSNSSTRVAKYSSKMMAITTLGLDRVATKANVSTVAVSKTADLALRMDRSMVVEAVSVGGRFGTYRPNKDFLMPTRPLPYFNPEIDLAFCFPHNKDFIEYWDRVDDRIYKLNHCLDINGVKKLMPAYAPEIDPALLARMVAGGMSFDEIAAALNSRLPNHRFVYLIEKSKQFTGVVQSFGQALFAAIEKKDGEELTLLRARHEQNILTLTTRNKKQQIEQAKTSLQTLLENKKSIEIRKAHYEGLVEEGLIPWENAEQIANWTSGGIRVAEGVLQMLSGTFSLLPQIGSPFAMKYGGKEVSDSANRFAHALESTAKIADNVAMLAGLEGSHQRREQEWQFQVTTATQELVSVSQQIRNAEIALQLAQLDFELHNTHIEQFKELYEFYTTKFSDYKHYTFQVRQLQQLYRMAFNLAHNMASQAQQAFDFERHGIEVSTGFIKNDNWNNEKLGLLAGEQLMLQLMQLEKEFIDTDKRKKEITQHFSMLQLAPDKLLALKTSGECNDFAIPEAAFDLMYPGYYRRIIKSVRISIPCIAGPYTNIGTTLTLGNNKIRAKTDDTLNDFNFTGCEAIATSNAQNDGGQFELNFRDERYLPFEGAGAVSEWSLSLPKTVRSFDYNTISDVIFHVSYTAEYDGVFKDSVENSLKAALNILHGQGLSRIFSLRHDFPNDWYKLNNANDAADLVLELRREHFPYFANVDAIKSVGAKVFILNKDNVLAEEADNLGISKTAKMKVNIPSVIRQRDLKDVIFIVNYLCG